MKLTSIVGTGSGKLGGSVFSVRNGAQVVRTYQPIVANPSSALQVQARAKLKLLSQLGEVMAPAIAFRRQGLVSPRNFFTKANYSLVTFANDKASIPYVGVDLTGGILALPDLTVVASASSLSVTLSAAAVGLTSVMYHAFRVEGDELRYVGSASAQAGDSNLFNTTIEVSGAAGVTYAVLAYGVRANEESARARFEDLQVSTSDTSAFLDAIRSANPSDFSFTETKGTQVLTV